MSQLFSNRVSFYSLTVNEILDILNEPDEECEDVDGQFTVVIQPPAEIPDAETDQDSDESDDEATADPNHLPRRLLAANAELLTSKDDVPEDQDLQYVPPSTSAAQPGPSKESIDKSRPLKRPKPLPRKWTQSTRKLGERVPAFQSTMSPTQMDLLKNVIKSPADCLQLFISEELINLLVEQSTLYAAQRQLNASAVTVANIKVMLAIMMLSGYSRVPYRRLYWRQEGDVFNSLVTQGMRRDTFEQLMRVLHLADNTKMDANSPDPFFKVRPLFETINKCNKLLVTPENLSVDETMIPYYGHHRSKQFIRGKPVRFGFKLWSICTTEGYLLHAEPYCGSATDLPCTGYGQGADGVLGLVKKCQLRQGHHVTFDNLFTSLPLLDQLSAAGIGGTGTARENRIPKDCILTPSAKMNKLKRGSISSVCTEDVALVRWTDNKSVTMMSNTHGVEPMQKVTRWSRQEKKKVTVDMPYSVAVYNRTMGGVDLHDQFVSSYRIRIRSKKWWWPLFNWTINSAVVNAWLMYRMLGHNIPLLQFIREYVLETITVHGTAPAQPGVRPLPVLGSAGDNIRWDGRDHWPGKGASKFGRCRHCQRRSAYVCTKCAVPVHPECMRSYHAR